MRNWRKAVALTAISASLLWTPAGVSAQQNFEQSNEGLCRRAPAPLVLDAEIERAARNIQPSTRAPPPPAAVTEPSADGASAEDEEAIVVTGARIVRQDFEAISPITTVGAEELELTATLSTDGLLDPVEPDTEASSGFGRTERAQPRPEAGLLTAGDHDDLLNPELYANYVDSFLENEEFDGVPRVDTRRVLTIQVEDRAGRPLPFANVRLTCGDGNQLTLATTADGTAVFFPELDRLGARVAVSVDYRSRREPMSRSVVIGRTSRAQIETVRTESLASPIRNFDLALVVDTTGSMSDELEYLKVELDSILGGLREEHPNVDIRVALVAYRDTTDEYITRTFSFDGDVSTMRGHLSRQRASGGGDYPEAVEQAMARAVALDWRENAVRSILFVADAPPHAEDVATTWRSAEVARAKRIQIVPVGASGVGPEAEYMMRAMAAVTQSRYIFLTDDSGIGNPHAPPAVDCYLVTSLESSIQRVLNGQISGRRIEPDRAEVVRAVGRYNNGRCRRST